MHGRVSDIWRSYIAQRIGSEIGMKVVFSTSMVVQFRNSHNYLADFDSENPLYLRSLRLIEQLHEWKPSNQASTSLPSLMEELWVFLYEHGYIELKDVILLQLWIDALLTIGYKFPKLLN